MHRLRCVQLDSEAAQAGRVVASLLEIEEI
jgi:hypothetical protein